MNAMLPSTSRYRRDSIDKNYTTGNLIIRVVLNRLLERLAGILDQLHVGSSLGLEVGCGEGNIIHHLIDKGVVGNIVAVDLQPEKLKSASQRNPGVDCLAADINRMIFKPDTFDYILAIEMFEHLPDPDRGMRELCRVAKQGAFLLISVPHEPFFHWGNLARGKYLDRMGKTPSHLNFWSRSQFRTFLEHYVEIHREFVVATFPWLLYLCRFPLPENHRPTD